MPCGRILHICSKTTHAQAFRSVLEPLPVEIDLAHVAQAAIDLLRKKVFHVIVATLGLAPREDWVEELSNLRLRTPGVSPGVKASPAAGWAGAAGQGF